MANNKEFDAAEGQLEGLASSILSEVIKADMSMHAAQIDAWMKFKNYRPKGELINKDVHIGFAEKRYLALNEVKLSFHIKSIPMTFYNRIKLAIDLMRGKSSLALYQPAVYDFCAKNEEGAIPMEIKVKRLEDGAYQSSHGRTAADEE